jgi:hypothetical protein
MLFGFIEVKPVVDLQGLIVPAAILVGVLLVFSDFIKPALSWLGSKAKTLVPSVSTTEPAELSASDRVQLWEQLYAACDPKHGACPKARELLNGVFPHLAPYHAEDAK